MDKIDKLVKRMKEDEKEYNNFWISSQRINEKELKQSKKLIVPSISYFDSIEGDIDFDNYDLSQLPYDKGNLIHLFDKRRSESVKKILSFNNQIAIHLTMILYPIDPFDSELNEKNYSDLCYNWFVKVYNIMKDKKLRAEYCIPGYNERDSLKLNKSLMKDHQYQFAGFTVNHYNSMMNMFYNLIEINIMRDPAQIPDSKLLWIMILDLRTILSRYGQPKYK